MTRPVRLYLAGPMSGYDDLNYPAFHATAAGLRADGYEVVNPAEINAEHPGDWTSAMRADIREMMTCDGIALLPGWEKSRGAGIEYRLALSLGFTVREL